MEYAQLFFAKSLNDLTYADIENFFTDEQEESDKIEFKSYYNQEENNHKDKENGVIRSICGMLNSAGGLIIWGAPIGKKIEGRKEKIFQGALSPCDKIIEKDAFISRVTNLITPAPKGIRFKILEKEKSYVFVIEVDQSFYSPHQFRNIYYMRIDGQTNPAPHHYVEALFKKVSFPNLELYLKINRISMHGKLVRLDFSTFLWNMSKLMNEYDAYLRVVFFPGTFANANTNRDATKIYDLKGHEVRKNNLKKVLYYNEPIMYDDIVLFDSEDLKSKNNIVNVHCFFAGKLSPLKTSDYELFIDTEQKDMNKLITKMQENIYAYESSDKLGLTDAERIKEVLGR